MPDDSRVEQLLEELLDSGGTPEEACRTCPELLPQVRAGWHRLRALRAEVGALFPQTPVSDGATPLPLPAADLPRIRGYDVQGVLGRGGMGVVYKAWHRRLHRPVAVKMLLAGGHAQPEELERFLREAETVAGLRHANIVQVHEAGDVDGRPYFTMEFVEGGSLAQTLAATPQPACKAAALVAGVAEAVHTAHPRLPISAWPGTWKAQRASRRAATLWGRPVTWPPSKPREDRATWGRRRTCTRWGRSCTSCSRAGRPSVRRRRRRRCGMLFHRTRCH